MNQGLRKLRIGSRAVGEQVGDGFRGSQGGDAHSEMSGIKKLSWKMEEGANTSLFCTRKP